MLMLGPSQHLIDLFVYIPVYVKYVYVRVPYIAMDRTNSLLAHAVSIRVYMYRYMYVPVRMLIPVRYVPVRTSTVRAQVQYKYLYNTNLNIYF